MLKNMSSEIMNSQEFVDFCKDKMCLLDGLVHYNDTDYDSSRKVINRQFYNEFNEDINILFKRHISQVDGEITFEVFEEREFEI